MKFPEISSNMEAIFLLLSFSASLLAILMVAAVLADHVVQPWLTLRAKKKKWRLK